MEDNDKDDNNNKDDNNDVNNNEDKDVDNINKDNKEEVEFFFSKVSSVIRFRNHKLGLI